MDFVKLMLKTISPFTKHTSEEITNTRRKPWIQCSDNHSRLIICKGREYRILHFEEETGLQEIQASLSFWHEPANKPINKWITWGLSLHVNTVIRTDAWMCATAVLTNSSEKTAAARMLKEAAHAATEDQHSRERTDFWPILTCRWPERTWGEKLILLKLSVAYEGKESLVKVSLLELSGQWIHSFPVFASVQTQVLELN